jgi:translocation and assembly module TamB
MLITSVPEGAVSVSPDVVVIQSKEVGAVHIDEGDAGNDFVKNKIDIDVDVLLNPDIHIQAFGLDTRLLGDLNIVKPVGLYQPRGEGQVTVKQGSYRAYGQNLKIGQGRLQFAGPLDNPSLSIRAHRPGLAVKAGVNVTGNARAPKLALFSEPSQSEADTLSYIITGRPIAGASGGEAGLIAQAAFSLGSEQSSVLANQIRDMFHLDDFSVGGGDSVDSTSLSASKRLSPNLTFRSSFNPFDQLWSFLLNYELTDNWSVQTESGVTQGADLIYSIESNSFRDLYDRFWDVIKF